MPTAWDTTVASQLHREGRHRSLYAAYSATGTSFVVTAPTVLETMHGLARTAPKSTRSRATLDWYRSLFMGSSVRVLPVDASASILAGRLRARHPVPPDSRGRDARTKPDRRVAWVLDTLVAATAWTAGYGIATRNRGDFEVLRDLITDLYPGVSPLAVEGPPDGKARLQNH